MLGNGDRIEIKIVMIECDKIVVVGMEWNGSALDRLWKLPLSCHTITWFSLALFMQLCLQSCEIR